MYPPMCLTEKLRYSISKLMLQRYPGPDPEYPHTGGGGIERRWHDVIVVLLFYVHGKHLRSCRDGQLT